jgi:hypothetical protein
LLGIFLILCYTVGSVRVNFFVEFPEEELKYTEEIDFPSTLVIAAESLDDFEQYSSRLQQINPELEAAYWPVVQSTYWPPPFPE